MLYGRWPGGEVTDEERTQALVDLGIDPGLSNRHIVRRLYPWVRGVERGTDDGIQLLIDGAVERYVDGRARQRARLLWIRRNLWWMVPLAVALVAVLVFILIPDLVFLQHV